MLFRSSSKLAPEHGKDDKGSTDKATSNNVEKQSTESCEVSYSKVMAIPVEKLFTLSAEDVIRNQLDNYNWGGLEPIKYD